MVTEVVTKGLSFFSLNVLRERARLAIVDPAGEWEAVAPLDYEQARWNYAAASTELACRRLPCSDGCALEEIRAMIR